ncbi:hypothetical protein ACQY0O_007566 [Thecaphora frezii]
MSGRRSSRRNVADYDDANDSDEAAMLQDALDEMVAEAEARDLLESQADDDVEDDDDDDDDDDYDPQDDAEYQGGDLIIEFAEEEEDENDDDGMMDDDDDDNDDGTIDIQELIRAHLAQSTANGNNDSASRTARALNSIGLAGLQRLLMAAVTGGAGSDDEDDEDDERDWYSFSQDSQMANFWDPVTEPIRSGQELLYGGEFGKVPRRPPGSPLSAFAESRNLVDLIQQRKYARRRVPKADVGSSFLPNTDGTIVAKYPARVYCGQYSQDSSFFYTCSQDFKVHVYDTTIAGPRQVKEYNDASSRSRHSRFYDATQQTSLKVIKSIQGRQGNWTITDANLSPDNQWMIYSSITPFVHLVPTRQHFAPTDGEGASHGDDQVMLDFSNSGDDDIGIWSIRFSGDSREIVAGAHFGDIYVYDIEARRRVLRVEGHSDDVNGVAFADSASSNVLISGSDDTYVKVWDRRSLSGGKPAGVFTGHTEGITYVSPKGDGRYCISNGKDQSLKLWDLRQMHSSTSFENMARRDYGLRNWDYRNMYYRAPRFGAHPSDCSVLTLRGHAVLKTLIRCHFSPEETTGQKYIYSGSADGRIHIWNLEGQVVTVLDRNRARGIYEDGEREGERAMDPSAPQREGDGRTRQAQAHGQRMNCTVRDVSWHSAEAAIMSTAWDGPEGHSGSIAKHELADGWKRGLRLEELVQRQREELAG